MDEEALRVSSRTELAQKLLAAPNLAIVDNDNNEDDDSSIRSCVGAIDLPCDARFSASDSQYTTKDAHAHSTTNAS